ncbi:MAG: carbon-nitrogen family hydrolase [Lachnospiraceae bacterium]|nr:carbon-nitrogen family hydrolase [Lachnospiraceae bacterium]
MKIALYQMNIIWEEKEKNLKKVEAVLEMISGKNVDLLLLPEMSLTGFSMNTKVTGESCYETVKKIKDLVTKYGILVGVGWTKQLDENKCENHYSIIGPDEVDILEEDINGNMEMDELDIPMLFDYAKLHPFSYSGEDKYFKGGDYQDFLFYKGFNISGAICYDLRFPEIFQIMSKKAELIIVPANWPDKRINHWSKLLMARAIENQCYIAGINCVGEIGGVYYSGGSALLDPNGEVMLPDELIDYDNDESVMIYDLENDTDKIRNSFPVKKDRREELYIKLVNS